MRGVAVSSVIRWSGWLLVVTIAAGCGAARRPYQAPEVTAHPAWSRAPRSASRADAAALAEWWTAFADPVLTSLVQRIVDDSIDVGTAMSRLREARAQAGIARATRMPAVSVGGSGTASHSSTEARGGIEAADFVQQSYGLDATASWEIDVFGERRSGIDAAEASAAAAALDVQDVLTSVIADAGAQYMRVRALQERIRLAQTNARLQADTLEIASFRVQAGLTTELDVHQARTNLESTRAQLAALQLEEIQATHALAVLVGGTPDSLNLLLATPAPIPTPPDDVAIGVPAEALRRRPDVQAAERRLAAQWANVDAARARLYPSFSLVGSIGLEALDLAKLVVPGAGFFRLSPSASWNIFDRRQLKQNVAVQDEREVQTALQYESTVLRALQDVEDALAAYAQEEIRRDRLTDAVTAAEQTAQLAAQRYNTGLRDFRDVLDAQRTLVNLQDQLASSVSNVSTAVVRLYRALGGGWAAMPPLQP
jgi:NodT family efflux transporter outer membrane factor (OMF) lipoprotein